MATFTITSTADNAGFTGTIDASGNGSGTLRQAINFANQTAANPSVVTTIVVDPALAAGNDRTITLQSNLPLVATSIDFNAAGLVLDGNNGQF